MDSERQTGSDDRGDYSDEIRFGVVMYGGVSLAVYINGVGNELFELACATPARDEAQERSAGGTRALYRRLSLLAANPALRAGYARAIRHGGAARLGQPDPWPALDTGTATRTRFSVDAISGTSAGGINGIFLAKALANGEQFHMLQDLWIAEGDVGLLLNDSRSYQGLPSLLGLGDRSIRPTSLLNSDRMYSKLLAALELQSSRPYRLAAPVSDQVDLYVTTTDIRGAPVALRLFDKVVYERRYRQHFHFSCDHAGGGNDFIAANNPFLAFAARCTSSFPFAFEPMTLAALERLKVVQDGAALAPWKRFFAGLPRAEVDSGAHAQRAFGDGGYLDNKPFSYVADVLARRQATMPLERKLIYVEPAPERIRQPVPDSTGTAPDALQNALAALTAIPQYEAIRDDLQAVLQRNRRIERIERLVRQGEDSLDRHGDAPLAELLRSQGDAAPDWGNMTLERMLALYGPSFFAYRRQRAYAVTDDMASRLCALWGIDPDSDEQYALRALVRVWREENFDDDGRGAPQTINAFLDQFDFGFRLRRLGFVLRKTDQLIHLFRKFSAAPAAPDGRALALSELETDLLARLPAPFGAMADTALPPAGLQDALRALALIKTGLADGHRRLQALQRAASRPTPGQAPPPALGMLLQSILGRGPLPPGHIPERWLHALHDAGHQASLCRTLQEGAVLRAQALYHADTGPFAPLNAAMKAELDAMRFKPRDARNAPASSTEQASKNTWNLLGRPRLACDAQGRVVASVEAVPALDDLNTPGATALRAFLGTYFLRFDSYDQISFPLYSGTDTGEPCTVEVVRISPADATALIDENRQPARRKLAGTALANFGAFLDRRWRLNDVMWGRLDGAERLIQAILPMADDDTATVRAELIELAHQQILQEALLGEGRAELAALMAQALTEAGDAQKLQESLRAQVRALSKGTPTERSRVESMLAALMSAQALPDYVRNSYAAPATPDPAPTMKNAARAVTIVGRMLATIGARRDKSNTASRWLARLGLVLQGLIAVAMPGALANRWAAHVVKVLYAFELFALMLALLFGNADARSMALTALLLTLGVHGLVLAAGDLLRERSIVLRWAAGLLCGAMAGLAAVGAWTVARWWSWLS